MRAKFSTDERMCRNGKTLCYDEMEGIGMRFIDSLPLNIMQGLVRLEDVECGKEFQQGMQNSATHRNQIHACFCTANRRKSGELAPTPLIRSRPDLSTHSESKLVSSRLLFQKQLWITR
jgi:hypothetical protein